MPRVWWSYKHDLRESALVLRLACVRVWRTNNESTLVQKKIKLRHTYVCVVRLDGFAVSATRVIFKSMFTLCAPANIYVRVYGEGALAGQGA